MIWAFLGTLPVLPSITLPETKTTGSDFISFGFSGSGFFSPPANGVVVVGGVSTGFGWSIFKRKISFFPTELLLEIK